MGQNDSQNPPSLDYATKFATNPSPPIPGKIKRQMIWFGIGSFLLYQFFIIVALFACTDLAEGHRHLVLKGWFVPILLIEGLAAWALSGRIVFLLFKYRRSVDTLMTIVVLAILLAPGIILGKGVINDVKVTGRVTSYSGNYYYGLYSNGKAAIAADPTSLGFADSYLVVSTDTTWEGPQILMQAQPGQIATSPQNSFIYLWTGFEFVIFPSFSYIGGF